MTFIPTTVKDSKSPSEKTGTKGRLYPVWGNNLKLDKSVHISLLKSKSDSSGINQKVMTEKNVLKNCRKRVFLPGKF